MRRREHVRRFSISLPPNLVEEFDDTWQRMEYENRSKAVHDAIRSFISDVRWMKEEASFMIGVVLVLYYLDKPKLVEEVVTIKNRFKKMIASLQQIYVSDNKMLEIIGVKGKVDGIRQLTQELMAKKGVKQVKTTILSP